MEELIGLLHARAKHWEQTSRIGDEAFEIAMEAAVVAMSKYDPARGAISTFLYKVIDNAMKDRLEQLGREPVTESLEEPEFFNRPWVGPSPYDALAFKETLENLSAESKEIITTLLDDAFDIVEQFRDQRPSAVRATVKYLLAKKGWSVWKIRRSFGELGQAFAW